MKKDKDLIYGGPKTNSKKKLIVKLSFDENDIVLGNLFTKNIDSEEFISLMDKLLNWMNEQDKQNSLFIIDNDKFHVSKKGQEYLKTKNINNFNVFRKRIKIIIIKYISYKNYT